MTVYYTNSDLTRTTNGTPLYTLAANDTLMVGTEAQLASTATGSPIASGTTGIALLLAGDLLTALSDAISLGASCDIRLTTDGSILSGTTAIALSGGPQEVTNAGAIQAEGYGIYATGNLLVTNSGLISGGGAIYASGALDLMNTGTLQSFGRSDSSSWWNGETVNVNGAARIINIGTIASTQGEAVEAGTSTDAVVLVNSGLIAAGEGRSAVYLRGAADQVTNAGTIDGRVSLGAGDDLYDGSDGTLHGRLYAGDGNDTVWGGASGEALGGDQGDDEISGGAGNDTVLGGAGADDLDGGDGYDLLSYAGSSAVLIDLANQEFQGGHAEGDLVTGFEAFLGSDQADTLSGAGAAERLMGGAGNDSIFGANGNDRLLGQAGNDVLRGGAGADLLSGGVGADQFRYTSVAESTVAVGGRDRILDFNAADGDIIDLATIDANGTANGNQTFAFIGNAAFSNVAGELRYQQSGTATLLQADTNGDGAADLQIQLAGLHALVSGNFLL